MIDVRQTLTGPKEEKFCQVLPGIDLEELLKLVGVVSAALQLPSVNVTPDYTIFGHWLSRQFSPNREQKFYIDPDPASVKSSQEEFLSLTDVQQLLLSIHKELETNRRSEVALLKNTKGAQLVREYFSVFNPNTIVADRERLKPQAQNLVEVVKAIAQDKPDNVEEIVEMPGEGLPDWLSGAQPDALTRYSSGLIKEIVTGFKEAALDAPRVLVRSTLISPISLREYLNDWLAEIFEKVPRTALIKTENGRQVEIRREFLEHTKFKADVFDLPEVTGGPENSDKKVLQRWEDDLFPALDKYLEQKASGGGAPFTEKKEDKTDKEESDLTKNKDALESTLKKFDDAGVSYRQEAARLSNELLPLFFSLHGLGNSMDELRLGLSDEQLVQFRYIERDFHDQLDYIFRHLTKEQIQALSTPDGRIKVLQLLFARLAGRREFTERIKMLAEVKVVARIQQTNPTFSPEEVEKKKQQTLQEVAAQADRIDFILKSAEGRTRINNAFDKTKLDLDKLSSFTTVTENATKGDFENLFHKILGNDFLSSALAFEALDAYMADLRDPERLRRLAPGQFSAIFGFAIPASLLDEGGRPTPKYWQFLNLCAEWLRLRQGRLTDHYKVDAISHNADLTSEDYQEYAEVRKEVKDEEGNVVKDKDGRVLYEILPEHQAHFTDEELDIRNQTQKRVHEYRDQGGAEVVVGARALNSAMIGRLTTNPYAKQIRQEHTVLQKENEEQKLRQQSLEKTRRRAVAERIFETAQEDTSYYQRQGEDILVDYNVLPAEAPIEIIYTGNIPQQETLSPLRSDLQFRQVSPVSKSLQTAKKAFNKADQALDALETLAAGAAGPAGQVYQALPKPVRRGVLVGAGVLAAVALSKVGEAISKFINGGLFTKVTTVVLGGIGGIGGSLLGGPILGTILGASGAMTGANIGYSLDASLGWVNGGAPSLSLSGLPSLPNPLAGAGTGAGAPGAQGATGLSKLVKGIENWLPKAVSPAAATLWGIGLVAGIAYWNNTVLAGAFLPPTLSGNGEVSKYVTITKSPNPNKSDTPVDVTYTVTVQAKPGYTLTLTSPPQDKITIDPNPDTNKNGKTTPPASPSYDAFTKQLSSLAAGTQVTTSPLTLPQYTIPFSSDPTGYSDSSITNAFSLSFSVKTTDGKPVTEGKTTTFTASGTGSVCFGKCPQSQNGASGCWPVTGKIFQGPYENCANCSHAIVDAVDIDNAAGTPAYATFDGQACYYDSNTSQPAVGAGIYGNHVLLSPTLGNFGFVYGHLQRFPDDAPRNGCQQVHAGDIVGYIDDTGDSHGNHLHYEMRIKDNGLLVVTMQFFNGLTCSSGLCVLTQSPSIVPQEDTLQSKVPDPIVDGTYVKSCYDK